MRRSSHWPEQLFLVATDPPHGIVNRGASPETMGSKAWNLLQMAGLGLPVPPALVIGTGFVDHPEDALPLLFRHGLPALEAVAGRRLGDARDPLVLSVRSGAAVSMPGMMETLLDIGVCDATVPGLLRQTGNPRLVWDCYRRLVSGYGEVVAGLPPALFENELARIGDGRGERELDFSQLRELTRASIAAYQRETGQAFPQDVREQVSGAVRAVLASWDSAKAREYRRLNHIDDSIGTAVTVQRMVLGNGGSHSGAGVGFSRDPSSGRPEPWIDFLINAQGEDVVAGRRVAHGADDLMRILPEAWSQLQANATLLERHFGDIQDFEFTVEDGVLWMLQTRCGKRTRLAAARIALDLLDAGVIDRDTARNRTADLTAADLVTRSLAALDGTGSEPLASATVACGGITAGCIAFDGERAAALVAAGQPVVLVRQDAETGDIAALESAVGLLTRRGARTSHAAVVARQLGRVCLVACGELEIDLRTRRMRLGGREFAEGDTLTLDGNQGAVFAGRMAVRETPDDALIRRLEALRDPACEAGSAALQATP